MHCWLFDKDKHALTLRTIEFETEEEAKERAWMIIRGDAPMILGAEVVIHGAEVWNEQKRVCRVERAILPLERLSPTP